MNRLLYITLLLLVPQFARAQSFNERTASVPAVSEKLDTADYPWNYPYRSKMEMINDMPPRISRRYRTTASLFDGPQRIDYLWMNNCPGVPDGDSVIASGSGAGCWYRSTFPVIAGDSVYIYRQGNVLRIDVAAMDSFMRSILATTPAGSIQNSDIAHWNRVYTSWLGDSSKLVRIDRTYTDPSWLNVSPSKVGAATPSYVDAGVAALKAYSDGTFQAKGNYRTTAQTLTISGGTLGITDGNTITLPTTAPYTAGTGISVVSNVITNTSPNQVVSVAAGTGIAVTGTYPAFTVATTSKQTLFYPDVVFTETAVLALGVGTRRITFTGQTGILTTDRVVISAATLPPTGYVLGDAVCTVNGTVVLSFYGPLLALGGTNTFPCRVTVYR